MSCPLCGINNAKLLAEINERPKVEIDYKIPIDLYQRKIFQCLNCKVYFNSHSLIDFTSFYDGHYNSSIDPQHAIESRFKKIIEIPFEKSDNKQRVFRVIKRTKELISNQHPEVLDVGSGTCVFLYELLRNWKVTASCIDPDPNAIMHVRKNIAYVTATIGKIDDLPKDKKYDLITLNKVLEHVPRPIEQLKSVSELLIEDGIVYLELPFGDNIASNNSFTENAEFNVEHITIYNDESIAFLAKESGLKPIEIIQYQDPSGKHSIYSFLKK